MEIRNVTKEDLPKMAKLLNEEALTTRSDICFEHSKLMINDDGKIVSFLILRQYSINEFLNGDVPLDNCEYSFQEMIDEYFSDNNQFELLYTFGDNDRNICNLYSNIRNEESVGLVWSITQNQYLTKKLVKYHFVKYNEDFLYDLQPYD